MTPQLDDVASRRIWTARDLGEVEGTVSSLTYLALLFFLSKHADRRAYVFVREETPAP